MHGECSLIAGFNIVLEVYSYLGLEVGLELLLTSKIIATFPDLGYFWLCVGGGRGFSPPPCIRPCEQAGEGGV